MSWIAEYDTQGREFPTCVHVTKTTGTMTHGVTYVPIEDGRVVRAENEKLRELVRDLWQDLNAATQYDAGGGRSIVFEFKDKARELGVEVSE